MATLTISQVCGVVVGQEEKPTPSRCDWHVSIRPLGSYILAHGGLTLATPSGLAGKQSWGKVRERGWSEEVAGRIGLPMLQNRSQGSWNEVNSMPTHRPDFGVICGLIWPNQQTGNAAGELNWPRTLLLLLLDILRVFVVAIFASSKSTVREQTPSVLLLYSLDTHSHTYEINSN